MPTLKRFGSALAIVALIAGAYTYGASTVRPAIVGPEVCTTQPVKVAHFGDSVTSWQPAYGNDWRQSWVYWASSNEFPAVGGWAQPGATLAQMAVNATDTGAQVVTIMGGTNDLPILAQGKPGTPRPSMLASIDLIVAKTTPEQVVILAVPPFGWNYHESNVWNTELAAHAQSRGWRFLDPWTGLRDPGGAWWPGTSTDLVHPAPAYTWHPGGLIFTFLRGLP